MILRAVRDGAACSRGFGVPKATLLGSMLRDMRQTDALAGWRC